MGIEVHVTREFIVNGKPYRSLEDIPPEYRHAIQGTRRLSPADGKRDIIVNGERYRNESEMPEGVREIYEVAMQCIGPGKGPAAVRPAMPARPIVPQGDPSSSGRWLMLGGLLCCLLVSLLLLLLPR